MSEVAERPPGADEVEIILQRAAPGEVEKGELVEEAGLAADELRASIEWLREHEGLEETDSGYRLGADEASAKRAEDPAPDFHPKPATTAGPALAAHVRSHFEVVCSFPTVSDERDDVAVAKAQAISTEIGNVLAAAMPHLSFHVNVSRVDAYDDPRTLFPLSGE